MLGVNKLNGDPPKRRYGQIGIPLSEVSQRLTALQLYMSACLNTVWLSMLRQEYI